MSAILAIDVVRQIHESVCVPSRSLSPWRCCRWSSGSPFDMRRMLPSLRILNTPSHPVLPSVPESARSDSVQHQRRLSPEQEL